MAVRLRLKKMGRAHRPFYRICAFDHRAPRDGRALEELGTYDTSVPDTNARVTLNTDRVDYWLSVGAQPTEKVAVLIKKYGTGGTHLEQQKAAQEKLAAPKTIPDPGAPASLPKKSDEAKEPEAAAEASADTPTDETPKTEASTEASTDGSSENKEEDAAKAES